MFFNILGNGLYKVKKNGISCRSMGQKLIEGSNPFVSAIFYYFNHIKH